MEIKVNDTILLGVDMNSIDALFQESLENLTAEDAAALMDILIKLFKTLVNPFKNVSLYRGMDGFESPNINYVHYTEPDVSYAYLRYENGKNKRKISSSLFS